MALRFVLFSVLVHCAFVRGLYAQPCEVAKLEGDPAWQSSFGTAVAISGDYAVVGDGGDGQAGETNTGTAYVFHRVGNSWQRQQKIFGSGTGFYDMFGFSVAIQGDRMIVGAPHFDPAGTWWGYAFVFQRQGETWVETQKLISSGSARNDRFGLSVSMSGDIVAVGAPRQNNFVGRVYVFRWNGSAYVEEASVVGADTGQDNFGKAVSISGDRLLVGVEDAPPGGAAYVFHYNGASWSQESKLTASDGAQNDHFGEAVAIDGDLLVIGAPDTDGAGPSSGSVYGFRRAQGLWTQEAELTAHDARGGDSFGAALALSGAWLVTGAWGRDVGGDDAGAAYSFRYSANAWTQRGEFSPTDVIPDRLFGLAVAYDGTLALVGGLSVAYVYAVPNGPPCIPTIGAGGAFALASALLVGACCILYTRRRAT